MREWARGTGRRPFLEQRLEQRGPVREIAVLCQGLQVAEEVASRDEPGPGLVPQAVQAVEHGVEGEGEQVDHRQQVGQTGLAVPEVVLQVVALAREAVEGLVFDKCELRSYVN